MSTENDNRVEVDVRCPAGTSLLLKLLATKGSPIKLIDSHELQLFCKDCTRTFKGIKGMENVQRILHIFTTQGEFVRTEVQFRNGDSHNISLEAQIRVMEMADKFLGR